MTDATTPVLVGIGTATQRAEDWRTAQEPLELMIAAARHAVADTMVPRIAARIGRILVPKGRWSYTDPAGAIARALGCRGAVRVLSTVGVLQQSLIGDACRRIVSGEIEAALVVGGDAGYRILRAGIAGERAPESSTPGEPDAILAPKEELRHEAERRAGLNMPVGLYAVLASAFRARRGWTVAQHRDRMAAMYSRFSAIAADNPEAWTRVAQSPAAIRDPSDRNPMLAFPYTKLHCSSWNVDQAAALLLCSVRQAKEAGIPADRWVFPWASTESNHMVAVCQRAALDRCPGARIAGAAALHAAGLTASEIDFLELYSCFPVAVEAFADELGIDPARDLTVTGGMASAGGPYNNYVFQATARMAALLRGSPEKTGLVSSVSGILTKQGFGLWSGRPAPTGFQFADVSDAVARAAPTLDVETDYSGPAKLVGYTIIRDKGVPPRAVAVGETPRATRLVLTTTDASAVARMEEEECCGAIVSATPSAFTFAGQQPRQEPVHGG